MSIDAIPDAILELIFLRIDSHFSLLVASWTCNQWRRIVAEAGFLRQFCTLHGPPVAGIYYQGWGMFNIEFEPSSAAIPRHRFSLDFLPRIKNVTPHNWTIRDSRGTLLLVDCLRADIFRRYMVVCEPLTQRYKRIPPFKVVPGYNSITGFLVDGEAGGGIGMSNFRVVSLLLRFDVAGHYHYDAGVFTASGSKQGWSIVSVGEKAEYCVGRTKGFKYFYSGGRKVLSLNRSTAEFSSCVLQETAEKHRGRVCLGATTGRDGEDRIVVFSGDDGKMTVFVKLHDGGSEWAAEKSVALSLPWSESNFNQPVYIDIARVVAGLIVVKKGTQRFRVDIDTNEVEQVESRQHDEERAHPCELPWPPTLRASTQLPNVSSRSASSVVASSFSHVICKIKNYVLAALHYNRR